MLLDLMTKIYSNKKAMKIILAVQITLWLGALIYAIWDKAIVYYINHLNY